MSVARVDGVAAEVVDDLEVMAKHVRVLVVLLRDVLADRRGERKLSRLPKRKRQNVGAVAIGVSLMEGRGGGKGWNRGNTLWRRGVGVSGYTDVVILTLIAHRRAVLGITSGPGHLHSRPDVKIQR